MSAPSQPPRKAATADASGGSIWGTMKGQDGALPGPGHNRGPTLEGGAAWRTHCWRRARADLLPVLPVEVVRLRVRRAAELGLDYRTYAGVRAQTGRDLVAFLFSTNALAMLRAGQRPGPSEAGKLAGLRGVARLVAAQPPLEPGQVAAALAEAGVEVAAAARAPGLGDAWGAVRARIDGLRAAVGAPGDAVLVIGATALEREWVVAGRLAGFVPAERYFAAGG